MNKTQYSNKTHHNINIMIRKIHERNRTVTPATYCRRSAHYTTWITFDMRLITPLVYFHEKLSEGLLPATLRLGSDSHPQSVLCELPVREPLPT